MPGTMGEALKPIEEKLQRGEALTPEEERIVMASDDDGNIADIAEINKAFEDAEDEEKKDKKSEKKKEPEEKEKDTKKEEEDTEEKRKQKEKEEIKAAHARIDDELKKPEDQVDVSDLPPVAKAYYRRMRREQKRATRATEERDRLIKLNLEQELRDKKAKEEKHEESIDVEDILKNKSDDDFIEAGEVKKLLKAVVSKKPAEKAEEKEDDVSKVWQKKYFLACHKAAKDKYDDFDLVDACVDEIFESNPEYQKEVEEAMVKGEDPIDKMYWLIKNDPDFDAVSAVAEKKLEKKDNSSKKDDKKETERKSEEDKRREAEEKEKKIEENQRKAKTSANHGGGSGGDDYGGYSLDEIAKMPDDKFFALPKAVRDKLFNRYSKEE